MVYNYGNPQIYSASAIVGLIDVNPELQGIVYQSNNTFVMKCGNTMGVMLTYIILL